MWMGLEVSGTPIVGDLLWYGDSEGSGHVAEVREVIEYPDVRRAMELRCTFYRCGREQTNWRDGETQLATIQIQNFKVLPERFWGDMLPRVLTPVPMQVVVVKTKRTLCRSSLPLKSDMSNI